MVRVFDHMKEQFFKTFPTQPIGDDESIRSQTSQGSFDLDDGTRFTCLAGVSQDTDIVPDDQPTAEDFWDQMTILMAEQCKKGKARAP